MTIHGANFLLKRKELCLILNITRQTLTERLKKNTYPLFVWVNDCGVKKVTKPSVQKQLDAMLVKGAV